MRNGAWLFGVMNVLWSWEKEREMNGYGGSTTFQKNGKRKRTLFLILKVKEYLLLFGQQSGVVVLLKFIK